MCRGVAPNQRNSSVIVEGNEFDKGPASNLIDYWAGVGCLLLSRFLLVVMVFVSVESGFCEAHASSKIVVEGIENVEDCHYSKQRGQGGEYS